MQFPKSDIPTRHARSADLASGGSWTDSRLRDRSALAAGLALSGASSPRKQGLFKAEWKKSDTGREAKFYSLTAKGRTQLKAETANWARLIEAVALVLKLREGGAL